MESVGEQRCPINTDLHIPNVDCTTPDYNAHSMHRTSARICTILEIVWNCMSWILYLVFGVCIWLCLMQARIKGWGWMCTCVPVVGVWCLGLVSSVCAWCLYFVFGACACAWCLMLVSHKCAFFFPSSKYRWAIYPRFWKLYI